MLAALQRAPLHGYGISQAVAARTADRIKLRPGNLYRVLDRMLERGLVEVAGSRGDGDDRRTDYRITPRGRKTAQAEAQRAKNLVGRVTKPTGGSGNKPQKEKPAAKPIVTVEDAEQAAIRETMEAIGMG